VTVSAAGGDLVVVHACEALGGGVLGVVQALADATARRGVPTVVVHGRRSETPEDPSALFDDAVRLVEVPGWGRRSPSVLPASRRAAAAIRFETARAPDGVLHLHSTFAGIVGRSLRSRAAWRTLYTPHGYAFLNPSIPAAARVAVRSLERRLGGRALTVACSDTEADVARVALRLSDVVVVRNGIDVGPLAPEAAEADTLVVVAAGRAAHQRRPDLFADTASLLRDRGFNFVWVGDGPARDLLERAGVVVTGWMSREDATARLRNAGVVAHFSAFEGLPLALLEAMAARRPIVASDLPVIREVVGDTALLVVDAGAAAAACERLHGDEPLRERLGAAARERAEQEFTVERMIEQMLELYGIA